ncbi:MarR family winged helix-turn-helix transcriptional regulator [soil metagenome]
MNQADVDTVMLAWVRLIRAQTRVVSNVEAALKAKGYPPLAWYDVLLELSRNGGRKLRPVELEKELLVAQYNLSRLIDRMEEAGLLAREPCDGDGRGPLVALTPRGKVMQKQMWPHCRDAVLAEMSALNLPDIARLGKLLEPWGGRNPSAKSSCTESS